MNITDSSNTNNTLYGGYSNLRLLPRPGGYYAGVWLGGSAQTGLTADPGRYGPLYGVLAVLLLAACLGGLAARYRKVSQS